MGKLVKTQNFSGKTNRIQLSLSGLTSGLYYLNIITDNYNEKQTIQIR